MSCDPVGELMDQIDVNKLSLLTLAQCTLTLKKSGISLEVLWLLERPQKVRESIILRTHWDHNHSVE